MGHTKAQKTELRGTSSLEGAPRLLMIEPMFSSSRVSWLFCIDVLVP